MAALLRFQFNQKDLAGITGLSVAKVGGAASGVGGEDAYTFTYKTLVEITGMDYDSVRQHRKRNNYNPGNLESVLIWLCRHGESEFRKILVDYALDRKSSAKVTSYKPSDFKSVLIWAAKNARPDLKNRMVDYALERHLPETLATARPKRPKPSAKSR